MKSKIKKVIEFLLLTFIFLPLAARAQAQTQAGLNKLSGLFGGGLAAQTSLPALIVYVIEILLFLAGTVAVLFIIIGGFMYITAGGNEEQAEKGRKALTNAIIGIVIIILSYTIITVVQNTVTSL